MNRLLSIKHERYDASTTGMISLALRTLPLEAHSRDWTLHFEANQGPFVAPMHHYQLEVCGPIPNHDSADMVVPTSNLRLVKTMCGKAAFRESAACSMY